ncbi:hypothetical protein TBLA_0D03230 [Henningerozyma blattae CBS 6284]|uniref:Ubiquitin-like domain-containing protein n=1 Tax=Henningerozyma blattae (strain ATCC 34711 / CBS 6284 / DSM 70876 / NBRC 10599 / NRRL Y-10934 / UCD 77-7) TaxID=1071380 RepID=I2H371_HENB6|nr:hypothetical protein TBLA_0D03230 [Tetrapisispora blattae CBS 6284]CCH60823.1 hypothetical protein TBLA_0D03230 [Tetrapisispora blattae CBS 6284]
MTISVHIKSGQNTWDVEIEASSTIKDFKDKIAIVSEIPAPNQRLIYSGKILKDDQTIESYKIQDGHSIHMVKSGAHATASSTTNSMTTTNTTAPQNNNGSSGMSTGRGSGFNPLSDLTSARYAGYTNLPSADMFGPDGGSFASQSQDDMLHMLENPVFQSQMNEMLSNPEIVDFLINSNPQLQSLGPQARTMFQSPMFRQMLTNPDMIRQSMRMAQMMNGGEGTASASSFPAPGDSTTTTQPTSTNIDSDTNATNNTNNATNTPTDVPGTTNSGTAAANPFAALFDPSMNPYAALGGGNGNANNMFNPAAFAQALQAAAPHTQEPEDNRPPEERYEHQLRQLNDMGFFDFDKNVAALRRSGGSVQGAVNALLSEQ